MTKTPNAPKPLHEEILPEWRGILHPNERILWQGAPGNDTPFEYRSKAQTLVETALLIVVPFFLFKTLNDANPPRIFIWIFGLVFTAGMFWQAIGRNMFAACKLRKTFYTLTTKRAFTGWSFFGHRHLDCHPITSNGEIEYKPGDPGSVYFTEIIHKTDETSRTEKIGFLNIPDAKGVRELLLKVQQGTA